MYLPVAIAFCGKEDDTVPTSINFISNASVKCLLEQCWQKGIYVNTAMERAHTLFKMRQ